MAALLDVRDEAIRPAPTWDTSGFEISDWDYVRVGREVAIEQQQKQKESQKKYREQKKEKARQVAKGQEDARIAKAVKQAELKKKADEQAIKEALPTKLALLEPDTFEERG